jgi:hypothetical protein
MVYHVSTCRSLFCHRQMVSDLRRSPRPRLRVGHTSSGSGHTTRRWPSGCGLKAQTMNSVMRESHRVCSFAKRGLSALPGLREHSCPCRCVIVTRRADDRVISHIHTHLSSAVLTAADHERCRTAPRSSVVTRITRSAVGLTAAYHEGCRTRCARPSARTGRHKLRVCASPLRAPAYQSTSQVALLLVPAIARSQMMIIPRAGIGVAAYVRREPTASGD